MAKWNKCCESWYINQKPSKIKKDRYVEPHHCPECKTPLNIIYEGSVVEDSMTDKGYGNHKEDIEVKVIGASEIVLGLTDNLLLFAFSSAREQAAIMFKSPDYKDRANLSIDQVFKNGHNLHRFIFYISRF